MTADALRTIERMHGVTAWLATAALVVAAWTVARRRPSAITGSVALALVLVTTALGLALHDPYRSRLRQRLFLDSAALGWLFERKQHLAFGAALLAGAALASILAAGRITATGGGEILSADLGRASRVAWIASAIFALAASIASVIVARHTSF